MSNFGLEPGLKLGFDEQKRKRITTSAITYHDVVKGQTVFIGENGYCYPLLSNINGGITTPSLTSGNSTILRVLPLKNGDFGIASYDGASNTYITFYRYDFSLINSASRVTVDANNRYVHPAYNKITGVTYHNAGHNFVTTFYKITPTYNYSGYHPSLINLHETNSYTRNAITYSPALNALANFSQPSDAATFFQDNNGNVIVVSNDNTNLNAEFAVYNSSGTNIKGATFLTWQQNSSDYVGKVTDNNILVMLAQQSLIALDCNNNYTKLYETNIALDPLGISQNVNISVSGSNVKNYTMGNDNNFAYVASSSTDVLSIRKYDVTSGVFICETTIPAAGFEGNSSITHVTDNYVILISATNSAKTPIGYIFTKDLKFLGIDLNLLNLSITDHDGGGSNAFGVGRFHHLANGEVIALNEAGGYLRFIKLNLSNYHTKYRVLQSARRFNRVQLEKI